ncbi:hypothetical protein SAMN05216490_2591 [Mucilaginibacter mallensis]|uniref:HTH luxR-type domain-containing protein n=1 Tax=Mucilaginibacter mallensis TaxID=652787 RepID=A0A1H1XZZ5_MUCMA|nr:hypothetical protein [Mucilaginibacter mallensis]SDT14763.1 hypothetical protein SAMN05216490_2591 [Mucilaginibacter mallensis]
MNISYTWALARKILIVFLALTILSSIAALLIRNSITQKLVDLTKLAKPVGQDEVEAEQILMLLHQAENDFQESLLSANSRKSIDYKTHLSLAFNQIDTLLKAEYDTSKLNVQQRKDVKFWYLKKLKLSDDLRMLKYNFDTLLTFYAGFNSALNDNTPETSSLHNSRQSTKESTNIVRKPDSENKKGLFGRIKDAIANKNGSTIVEINHTKNIGVTTDITSQKILAQDKKAYVKKLQQLQQQNVKLLDMQRKLITLNTYINNELERIVNESKEINYHVADEFRETAFKNYQETTSLLNSFYLVALFLVLIFAVLLILFILQLNKAELLLRKENSRSITRAQEKINELVAKIESSEKTITSSKIEELKEVVQLVISNNPAFLTKFNELDPDFCQKLLSAAPNLVATEIEFCILLRLNFETKEIARYTKSSVRAVEGKKYRIRRKLNIPSDQDITIWMINI